MNPEHMREIHRRLADEALSYEDEPIDLDHMADVIEGVIGEPATLADMREVVAFGVQYWSCVAASDFN